MRQQLADATSNYIGRRHSLTLRQTPRWAQSLILILLVFGGAALASSFIIKIDEVITVSGVLRPISGTGQVLAPVTATIESLEVQDGDIVERGQILAIYDTRKAIIRKSSLLEKLKLSQISLKQNLALRSIENKALMRNKEFTKDMTERFKYLTKEGASSEITQLNQEKQLADIESQLIRLDQQTEETKTQFRQRIGSIKAELDEINLLLKNSKIKSNVAGTIFNLAVSPRQVVTLGQDLMQIIPGDAAKAQVFVGNGDIGFVKLGQVSQVRVDAYPFTKFGDLDGSVTSIGADILEPDQANPSYRYPVTITLASPVLRSQGRELPLKPGMSVQANLRLREKRLISIVTDMFSRNVEGLKTLRN